MVNITIILTFMVFIPLLVSCYKDKSFNVPPVPVNNNIKRITRTNIFLFTTDTKIYYIRRENNEVKYTVGKKSIHEIIYDGERHNDDEKLSPDTPVSHLVNENIEDGPKFDIIHPEILVIVDYDLFERFNKSENLIVSYLVSYWNSVDMRFYELLSPMIQLNIAGIIIAEDAKVLTYLRDKKHVQNDTEGSVLSVEALIEKGRWLFNLTQDIISLCDYDMAITMTSNSLCSRVIKGHCLNHMHGITRSSKVCFDDLVGQRTEKIAIVQNEGAYDKINFVARQIGLLLGSNVVGNSSCLDDDGTLSSRNLASVKSSHWSECSERNFGKLSKSPGGRCLRRLKIFRGLSLATYFPGSVMNADEQCRKLGWTKACQIDESMCQKLKCTNSKVNNNVADECTDVQSEAPDGTPCGKGKVCMLSECE